VDATSDETASAAVPGPPEDGTDEVALGDVRLVVRLRFDAALGALVRLTITVFSISGVQHCERLG
jgi:hypothetical protein